MSSDHFINNLIQKLNLIRIHEVEFVKKKMVNILPLIFYYNKKFLNLFSINRYFRLYNII